MDRVGAVCRLRAARGVRRIGCEEPENDDAIATVAALRGLAGRSPPAGAQSIRAIAWVVRASGARASAAGSAGREIVATTATTTAVSDARPRDRARRAGASGPRITSLWSFLARIDHGICAGRTRAAAAAAAPVDPPGATAAGVAIARRAAVRPDGGLPTASTTGCARASCAERPTTATPGRRDAVEARGTPVIAGILEPVAPGAPRPDRHG